MQPPTLGGMATVRDYLERVATESGASSTRALAKVLGVSHMTVQDIRTGKRHGKPSTWLAIAKALHVPAADVFLAGMTEAEADDEARAVWLRLASMVGNALASERAGRVASGTDPASNDVSGHYAHSQGRLRSVVRRRSRRDCFGLRALGVGHRAAAPGPMRATGLAATFRTS